MTFNGEMTFLLRYFTEFVYDVVVTQLLGLPRFQNLLLIVYDHINTICAIIQRLSVCLYVSVSAKRRYCIKTAKRRITQTTPRDSTGTLVF